MVQTFLSKTSFLMAARLSARSTMPRLPSQEVLPSGYLAPPSLGVRPDLMEVSYCMAQRRPLMGPSVTSVDREIILNIWSFSVK